MGRKRKNPRKGAEEFFYENAGYSYDPKTQTEEEGHRETAKKLAEAEQWAWDNNYEYFWEDDPDAWQFIYDSDVDPEDVGDVVWVRMENPAGENVQSLGGIMEGHDAEANRNYRRVVEAELAYGEQRECGPMPYRSPNMGRKNPRKGAEEFFYEQAGYSYDPKTQTEEEGRRETAKALADAEQWARDNDYTFEWDEETLWTWDEMLAGTEIDPADISDIVHVVMKDSRGYIVQSLGAVTEGHDHQQNRNYRRVVEAELALQQQEEERDGNPTNRLVVTADSEHQARTRGRRFGEVLEVREVGPDKYWVYVNQRSGNSAAEVAAPSTKKLKSKLLR